MNTTHSIFATTTVIKNPIIPPDIKECPEGKNYIKNRCKLLNDES